MDVVAIQVEKPKDEVRVGTESEQALIKKFEKEMMVPSWLRAAWEQWEADRVYVNKTCFGEDDSRALVVNLAARAIQKKQIRIEPTESDVVVMCENYVGSVEWARNDAIRAADAAARAAGIQPDPQMLLSAGAEAERKYRVEAEKRERFANTSECVLRKQFKSCDIRSVFRQCTLSTFTTGISWVKCGWQFDYSRDSLGNPRHDDAQDQIALLQVRAAEFAGGVFGENDSQYQEMLDLADYVRDMARKVINEGAMVDPRMRNVDAIASSQDQSPIDAGWIAEPKVWAAPTVSVVRPENMRWDWRYSPDLAARNGDWIAEQVLMDRDEAMARFKLSPQEGAILGSSSHTPTNATSGTTPETLQASRAPGAEPQEPGKAHYENSMQEGKVVVWDRYDFKTGKRYVWCSGLTFFSVKEPVEIVDERRGPYECLSFNQLCGSHLPVSEVRFMRKLMDAINQRLTDGQESLWASMKRYLVKKGAFAAEELAKLRGSVPHDVIECEDPAGIRDSWMEISSDDWRADKYDLSQLYQLFELTMGMSMSELGIVDAANTATEANIAAESSTATNDRHASILAEFATNIANKMLHYDCRYLSEDTVKKLTGSPLAVWPSPTTREELIHGLRLEVLAAGNRRLARGQEAAALNSALDALRKVAAAKGEMAGAGMDFEAMTFVQPILRLADVRGPAREAVKPMQQAAAAAPPIGGMPTPPVLPQGSQPTPGALPG